MRILHVIHSADPRGGGPIEALTVRAGLLAALGHRVDVATCDDPAAPFVRAAPLPVHAFGPGIGKFGYAPRLLPWLRRHHAEYDAIIVNGVWQYNAVAVRRALHGTGRSYHLFPHGMLDPWFRERYPLKHLKKIPYWLLVERFNVRDAASVLFTSEEERVRARRSFPLYRATERISPYGVAAPAASRDAALAAFRDAFPVLVGQRLLCFMGRIHEKKGCDLLLEAFARTAQRQGLHLVIAGPDEGPEGVILKQRARTLGVESSVTWTGMLRGAVKQGALAAAEAFVLPSHQENFGVAVAEALACGTPVLISDKVNIWREIEAAGAGLVASDDLAGTVSLLERWLATPASTSEQMRHSARALFEERFDVEKSLDRFLDAVVACAPGLGTEAAA